MAIATVVILGVIWLFVSLVIGYDAQTHSQQDPLLWGATTFCFGIAGLFGGGIAAVDVTAVVFLGMAGILLYLNLGRRADAAGAGGWRVSEGAVSADRPRLRDCPNCRARELVTAQACRFCGATLVRPSEDDPWFNAG